MKKELTEKQTKNIKKIRQENKETAEKIKDTKYMLLIGSLAELSGNLAAAWLKFLDDREEFQEKVLDSDIGRDALRAMAITAMSNAKEVESYGGYNKERIHNANEYTIATVCLSLKEMKEAEETKKGE